MRSYLHFLIEYFIKACVQSKDIIFKSSYIFRQFEHSQKKRTMKIRQIYSDETCSFSKFGSYCRRFIEVTITFSNVNPNLETQTILSYYYAEVLPDYSFSLVKVNFFLRGTNCRALFFQCWQQKKYIFSLKNCSVGKKEQKKKS